MAYYVGLWVDDATFSVLQLAEIRSTLDDRHQVVADDRRRSDSNA